MLWLVESSVCLVAMFASAAASASASASAIDGAVLLSE